MKNNAKYVTCSTLLIIETTVQPRLESAMLSTLVFIAQVAIAIALLSYMYDVARDQGRAERDDLDE